MTFSLYALYMNHMTQRHEHSSLVRVSDSVEKLIKFMNDERVEPYYDGKWSKIFRQNGPLEWYNEIYSTEVIDTSNKFSSYIPPHGIFKFPTLEEYLRNEEQKYLDIINGLVI